MMQVVRWDDLELLLEVARSRTMTEAADRLGVDQTTISRRLRGLESLLGVQLVVRRRDGISLTEAGREGARAAERMETIRLDLERDLVGADSKLEGRLRVTTVDITTQEHPDLFTEFAERYPAVDLEVETQSQRRSLSRREADVAIRWMNRPEPGPVAYRLAEARFAIYASHRLKASVGARAKLTRYPWLAVVDSVQAAPFGAFMRDHVPARRIVCRYEDLYSLRAAIRAGAGVGFLPCVMGEADPELARLRLVPDVFYDVWSLAHPDLMATARVRSFVEHARTYFAARADLYAGKKRRRAGRE